MTFRATHNGVTFIDPASFEKHAKTHGLRPPRHAKQIKLRKPRPPTQRPFLPETGDVGSWVRTPWGTLGQVWSIKRGGKWPVVWVADGERFHDLPVRSLAPVTLDEPLPLEEEAA